MQTPIFWLITQEARVKLLQLNWKLYGTKIEIPPEPSFDKVSVHVKLEQREEIDKLMRQPPSRSRGKDV